MFGDDLFGLNWFSSEYLLLHWDLHQVCWLLILDDEVSLFNWFNDEVSLFNWFGDELSLFNWFDDEVSPFIWFDDEVSLFIWFDDETGFLFIRDCQISGCFFQDHDFIRFFPHYFKGGFFLLGNRQFAGFCLHDLNFLGFRFDHHQVFVCLGVDNFNEIHWALFGNHDFGRLCFVNLEVFTGVPLSLEVELLKSLDLQQRVFPCHLCNVPHLVCQLEKGAVDLLLDHRQAEFVCEGVFLDVCDLHEKILVLKGIDQIPGNDVFSEVLEDDALVTLLGLLEELKLIAIEGEVLEEVFPEQVVVLDQLGNIFLVEVDQAELVLLQETLQEVLFGSLELLQALLHLLDVVFHHFLL